jgi:hypothetical protein
MKHRVAAAFAALCAVSFASSALAEPVIAKLQTPVASATRPVASDSVYECLGDICAARAGWETAGGMRGCRDLARQVGAVTAFGTGAKQLTADKLTECNQSARH